MLLGLILSSLSSNASCFDVLSSVLKQGCIGAADVIEFRQGQSQVYACEVEPDLEDVIAIFTLDPDFPLDEDLEVESCSGGSLYLSDRVSSDVLLRVWGDYMDIISWSSL